MVTAFDGGAVTSDAGALLQGASDRAIGLVGRLADCFCDERRADMVKHRLPALIGQRVFAIALGYEDVNDADRLGRDPAMRWIVGGRAVAKQAASTSQMGRFETRFFPAKRTSLRWPICQGNGLTACTRGIRPRQSCSTWIPASARPVAIRKAPPTTASSPATCYHPLFVFKQFGDLERSELRPGNVHSADGWRGVLEPVVERYPDRDLRRYLRGAMPPSPHRISMRFWRPRVAIK